MTVNYEGSTGEGRVWEYIEILAHTANETRCSPRQILPTKTHSALPGLRRACCVVGEGEPWSMPLTALPQNHVYSDTWRHLLHESFLRKHNIMASKIIITAFKIEIKLSLRQMRVFLKASWGSHRTGYKLSPPQLQREGYPKGSGSQKTQRWNLAFPLISLD